MKRVGSIILICLVVGALIGAWRIRSETVALENDWMSADASVRQVMLYGEFAAVVDKVRTVVPPGDGLLLYASVDPALFPYAMYPRRIVQVGVEPETDRMFMQRSTPTLPKRSPESFAVDWTLWVTPGLLRSGGELRRHGGQGGADR